MGPGVNIGLCLLSRDLCFFFYLKPFLRLKSHLFLLPRHVNSVVPSMKYHYQQEVHHLCNPPPFPNNPNPLSQFFFPCLFSFPGAGFGLLSTMESARIADCIVASRDRLWHVAGSFMLFIGSQSLVARPFPPPK